MPGRCLLLVFFAAALTACGEEISAPPDRNEPPRPIAGISNQQVTDSVTLRLSAYFADPDGDPLTFTAESSDAEVARIEVMGEIARIYAVAAGSSSVAVTATDPGGLTASQGFVVIVPDRAPHPVGAIPAAEAPVGEEVTIGVAAYFEDPDRDPLNFTAESSDTAVAVVSVSGDSVTVRPIAPGMASITVTAADPGGLTATQAFAITVPNRPPHATDALPHLELRVGDETATDLSAHFSDPDGQPLAFTAESSEGAVAAVGVSGRELTLTASAKGTASITVTATDPGGLTATQTFSVTVPNRAPAAVGATPDVELRVGEEAAIDALRYFSDPDGDSLTFTAASSDTTVAAVSVSDDSVTVRPIAPGMAAITVTAADPGGLTATQAFAITVPNRPPHATDALPHLELRVGEEAATDLSAHFSDPDGQPLAFTAESSDGAVAAVGVSGRELTLTASAKGTASITVTATDPGGLTATQTFSVTVPNRAPAAVGTTPDVELRVGEEAVIDAPRYFSDPDGDPLTFAAASSDIAVTVVSVSGNSITVRPGAPGMAAITVTASDPGGLTATQAFAITVPNRPPHATDALPHLELRVGDETATDLSAHFSDPDGQPLAFTAESSDDAVAAVGVSGRELTLAAIAKGTASITVTATDPGGLTATQTFSVTVPNRAPAAIGATPDIELRVGEEAIIDAPRYFSDPDGDPLTFSAASSDIAVTVVSVSGNSITVRPSAPGMAAIAVTATDPGGLTATQTFSVTVPNRAPAAVGATPDIELRIGEEAAIDALRYFSDPDGDSLTFTAASSDTTVAAVSVSDDSVTVRPSAPGMASIAVTATDPGGLTATQIFSVTVPNRAPATVGTIPDVELRVGEEAVIDAPRYFSDPDGDPLTFAAASSDTAVAAVSVSGNSITVRPGAPGMAAITVTASDPGGLTATQAFAITVPNRPPHATDALPHLELRVGDEGAADLSAHFADPDGQPLAFTAESSDDAVAAAGVSGRELTLAAIAKGTASITVTATDPGGLTATQTFSVTVPNRAPATVGTTPGIELRVGEEAVIDAPRYFSDPDGDPLTFTAESSDTAVAAVSVSGDSVTVRPTAPGMASITVTATDPDGLTATQAFAITVPNRPPHATDALSDVELRVGDEGAADLSAHFADPDGQPLAFTAESSDGAVAAVGVSGRELTLAAIARGTASIAVTATDPGGLTATQTFSVTVLIPRPPNRPPATVGTIPGVALHVGEEAVIDASRYFADPDGQPLAFTAESSDDAVAAVGVSGRELTLTAIARGTASIAVTATDPGGLTATQTFSVTVLIPQPPNRAPATVGTIPDVALRVGEEAVIDASRYFSDPDGQPLVFTARSSDNSLALPVASGHEVRVRALANGTVTITVTATDPGGLSATQTFTVVVRDPGGGDGFSISLHFTDAVPGSYQPTLESAAHHLMAILSGTEWDDVAINGTRECFGQVALGIVDDVAIRVDAVDMDGDLGVVARAGACIQRADSAPVLGSVRLDRADLALLAQHDDLFEIMVHEIIHVLGFGPRWVSLGLLDQDSDPVFDPHFTGPRAIAAFDAAGGAGYTGEKVPTEPGQGHWRDSVFGSELMDSFLIVNRREPLSAITLEALVDMGYAVDLSYAEPFQLPVADRMAADAEPGTAVEVRDEVDRGPILVVDRDGRTVRVIPPR